MARNTIRTSYKRLAAAMVRQALNENDFDFPNRPIGQSAIGLLGNEEQIKKAFFDERKAPATRAAKSLMRK